MPSRRWQELCNVKSISNYDAIREGWYDAEARQSKLFTLLTPRLDEELAGNIVTT